MSGCNSEEDEKLAKRPEWLDDEPEVVAMLTAFLDKLDHRPTSERARIPSVPISKSIAPVLHRHDESADRTWALVRSLEGIVFDIRLGRKRRPYDPEYVGASLRFLDASEAICRDWLFRPMQIPYQRSWAAAVEAHADAFADQGATLLARPLKVAGKSAHQVVDAFAKLGAYVDAGLTLRQLSARVFWGLSKVLDARVDLLHQLYPGLVLAPRPVLVHVYLPNPCTGVLFVENQDTYVQALAGKPAEVTGLALVYSAGFRGSAERIRGRNGVSLHYQGASERELQAQFERWWFEEKPEDWPVWFWGDLDFAGMAILKAMRQRFGGVQAWQPGYAPMVELIGSGGGHSALMALKAEQIDPETTGCIYADETLLPTMREVGRFVDQETL